MPRHLLTPISRAFQPTHDRAGHGRHGDGMDWKKLDRVQVLGTGHPQDGHMGCVNALSWSDDGGILLSGSDDKRLCLWTPDTSPLADSPASRSPHPIKLSKTIKTGHHANIFSAKFLPNAGTPTIVSVAGDREIRLMEVERLGDDGRYADLRGQDGPGVRVLKCHRDRTKKIATENSPFLFMTVSEDGTVRQHDLRRPHRCPTDCPPSLFRAPYGVDLYSLSVSPVAPHIFAVAGRTDTAFVCDRRMVERQNPSWGNKIVGSGQVHCVRRLGLSEEEWDSVTPEGPGRRAFAGERHITCVRMSSEHADEAVVAFARHSTSLFSIYDSPGTSSMRKQSSTVLPSLRRRRKNTAGGSSTSSPPASPTTRSVQPINIRTPPPTLGKRRQSALSPRKSQEESLSRARVEEPEAQGSMASTEDSPAIKVTSGRREDLEHVREEGEDRIVVGNDLTEEAPNPDPVFTSETGRIPAPSSSELQPGDTAPAPVDTTTASQSTNRLADLINQFEREQLLPPDDLHPLDNPDLMAQLQDHDIQDLLDREDELYGEGDWTDDDGPSMTWGEELDALYDVDDEDEEGEEDENENEEDDFDEDEEMDEFEFDDDDDDMDYEEDEDEDGQGPIFPDRRSEETEFGGVEMISPRRIFKGAKNVETVKDCNFLGTRADKVCSGSDDGHFFVWDKETGRLEGIWEGDASIVNVMEQHPTLPVVAVSGIDETVKIFAPTSTPPRPSLSRINLQESIIRANTDRRRLHMGSTLNRVNLLHFLASQGMSIDPSLADEDWDGDGAGGDGDDLPECATQ